MKIHHSTFIQSLSFVSILLLAGCHRGPFSNEGPEGSTNDSINSSGAGSGEKTNQTEPPLTWSYTGNAELYDGDYNHSGFNYYLVNPHDCGDLSFRYSSSIIGMGAGWKLVGDPCAPVSGLVSADWVTYHKDLLAYAGQIYQRFSSPPTESSQTEIKTVVWCRSLESDAVLGFDAVIQASVSGAYLAYTVWAMPVVVEDTDGVSDRRVVKRMDPFNVRMSSDLSSERWSSNSFSLSLAADPGGDGFYSGALDTTISGQPFHYSMRCRYSK